MGCKCVDEYDNEDVRKLIERPEKPAVKSPRYRSRHTSRTIREIARSKSAHKTLGQPRVPLKPPSAYLRKGEGPRPRRSKSSHKHYRPPDYARQLPDWKPAKRPARRAPGDLPDLPRDPCEGRRSAGQLLDFCKRNVEGVVEYRNAKVQSIKFCDTRHGDRQELRPSGLQLTYVHKKNYGGVPQFVKTSRDDRKRSAAAAASQRDRSQAGLPTGCVYLTEDQRAKLLESMKVKRASLMKTFQCLPFVIDTAPKIKRKAALEDKLKQVEKDIELFESHPYIFVYNE